jgi:hypothetical protein
MVQYYMPFLMMYSKLGNKLTNVKIARMNKLLIAFVHIELHWQTSIFSNRLRQIYVIFYCKLAVISAIQRVYRMLCKNKKRCLFVGEIDHLRHYIAAHARKRQSRKD